MTRRGCCSPTKVVRTLLTLNILLLLSNGACSWWLSTLALQHGFQNEGSLDRTRDLGRVQSQPVGSFKLPNKSLLSSPCSNIVRGPIPTTLPEKHDASCTWSRLEGKHFSNVAGSDLMTNQLIAKERCVQLGSSCRGVTCQRDNLHNCTAMTGQLIVNASTISYMKSCLFSGHETFESTTLPVAAQRVAVDLDFAIVVLAHDRKKNLLACLESLLRLSEAKLFKIYVSLDEDLAYVEMREVIINVSKRYQQEVAVWIVEQPKAKDPADNEEQQKWFSSSTGKIAHHYWSVFERIFAKQEHEAAIFLEEDLVVAPDFLALFLSTAWVLREDPSVWCVSAWNDAGFSFAVSDQCRLFRSTYFPGLGFMLPRNVWIRLREEWPSTPTMGWDYWMRTAFRRADKECIVPEVPRSRHASRKGSSVVTHEQVEYFELMAFAQVNSQCDTKEKPCTHFGNINYVLRETYEFWMHFALHKAERLFGSSQLRFMGEECRSEAIDLGRQESADDCAVLVGMGRCSQYFGFSIQNLHWGCRCCHWEEEGVGKEHPGKTWSIYEALMTGNPEKIYVYPYTRETYMSIAQSFGVQPEGMSEMVPPDVRAEHYGLVVGKQLTSQATVLLVDQRSPKQYLPTSERLLPSPKLAPTAGAKGESCDETCNRKSMSCSVDQLHFLNNCGTMTDHFACKYCAHQAGLELPAYVVAPKEPTVGQCLITFISKLRCDAKHPSTRRLCPCMAA